MHMGREEAKAEPSGQANEDSREALFAEIAIAQGFLTHFALEISP